MRRNSSKNDLIMKIITICIWISLSIAYARPYVLVVSFDGFKHDYADNLHTPNFDRLENDGSKAKSLISVFPSFTFPNHYSIATGTYAGTHGLIANKFYRKDFDATYSLRDKNTVQDGKWYGAEPIWVTAEKQGIKSATYFWVGSEAKIKDVRPSIFKHYDGSIPSEERINSVMSWFSLPNESRPQLCMLYFSEPDYTGHKFGPHSAEVDSAVVNADKLLGKILHGISELGIKDSLNLIVLSDHGMTTIDKEKFIFLDKFVKGLYDVKIDGKGPMVQLHLRPTKSYRKTSILRQLKRIKNIDVYLKEDVPFEFHITNENSGDIFLVAHEGYSIFESKKNAENYNPIGMHGYDPNLESMHSIFYAYGPQIKNGKDIDSFENIHIYPLICKLLNIQQSEESEGEFYILQNILK
jgi:predicted AlkP superfamily pyrophosphatase or phosphodiesterase